VLRLGLGFESGPLQLWTGIMIIVVLICGSTLGHSDECFVYTELTVTSTGSMATDGLQQVNEKEFADLHSRCRVNIVCSLVFYLDIFYLLTYCVTFIKRIIYEPCVALFVYILYY